ncbi:hypothetical protein [Cronobacter phage vB_Cdu_VP8]|nr:hypothetical protein [Cronobacter phage vB_Cdu_VP8]
MDVFMLVVLSVLGTGFLYGVYVSMSYSNAHMWFKKNEASLIKTFENHGMELYLCDFTDTGKITIKRTSPVRSYALNLGRDPHEPISIGSVEMLDLKRLIKKGNATDFLIHIANMAPISDEKIEPML